MSLEGGFVRFSKLLGTILSQSYSFLPPTHTQTHTRLLFLIRQKALSWSGPIKLECVCLEQTWADKLICAIIGAQPRGRSSATCHDNHSSSMGARPHYTTSASPRHPSQRELQILLYNGLKSLISCSRVVCFWIQNQSQKAQLKCYGSINILIY